MATKGTSKSRLLTRNPGYDESEIMSAVCRYHCEGLGATEIVQRVAKAFRIKLTREEPFRLIRKAAKAGRLRYEPPAALRREHEVRESYRALDGVRVVHTAVERDVAYGAAKSLTLLLEDYGRRGKKTVHVGFAGGHTMRALARALAERLCEPSADLPDTVVFHALAAGFDPKDPTTDPNSFVGYFLNEAVMQVEPAFEGLSAPAIVRSEHFDEVKELPDIARAFQKARTIDIVATSGTEWADPDCALRQRMKKSAESMEVLASEGCICDLLWRPISRHGPIMATTEFRALTLLELTDLQKLIKKGKHVLLVLAPCGACNRTKGQLLKDILSIDPPLISDLVVDSRSAGEMLGLA